MGGETGGGTGGVGQTLVTNVKDAPYSATGDGTTNDTAAIIAAIAATPDGGTVWFPPGTYVVENINVTNRHGLTFNSPGANQSILKRLSPGSGGNDTLPLLYFSGAGNTDITVQNLGFDMNNCLNFCGGPKFGHVMRFKALYNHIFDSNLNTTNTNDKFGLIATGDQAGTDTDALIFGNVLDDTQMEVDGVSGVTISSNFVTRPRMTAGIGVFSQSGASGRQVKNVKIINNHIVDGNISCGSICIDLDPANVNDYSYYNMTVQGNTIVFTGTGTAVRNAIKIGSSSTVTATTGNTFRNFLVANNVIDYGASFANSSIAIALQSSAVDNLFLDDFKLIGNLITLRNSAVAGGQGMNARFLRNSVIEDNQVNVAGSNAAAVVATGLAMAHIKDNIFYGTNTSGSVGAFHFDNSSANAAYVYQNYAPNTTNLYTTSGASGTLFFGYTTPFGILWNLTTSICTGDSNGGKLTVNASNQIICAADIVGAGGVVDQTANYVWTGTHVFNLGLSMPSTQSVLLGTAADGARLKYFANSLAGIRNAADSADANIQAASFRVSGSGFAASPQLQSIGVTGGTRSGSNSAAASFLVQAAIGSGTGTAGILTFSSTLSKQATGSSSHPMSTLLTLGSTQTAHPGTAGAIADFTAATFNDENTAASGTAATLNAFAFQRPTVTARNTPVTTTDASTVYIANSPLASTNMTLTNIWALNVAAGAVRLGDLTTSPGGGTAWKVVCVDQTTGRLRASTASNACN